jgi:hypothetical protein
MREALATVYHGTAASHRTGIERDGIQHRFGRGGYVYVTTDHDRALYYARPATAFAITVVTVDGYWPPTPDFDAPVRADPVGLIVVAEVPAHRLKDDPYNPTGEPDQYRIYRGIPPEWIVALDEVAFPELREHTERVLAYTLWSSIQRSLWKGP